MTQGIYKLDTYVDRRIAEREEATVTVYFKERFLLSFCRIINDIICDKREYTVKLGEIELVPHNQDFHIIRQNMEIWLNNPEDAEVGEYLRPGFWHGTYKPYDEMSHEAKVFQMDDIGWKRIE